MTTQEDIQKALGWPEITVEYLAKFAELLLHNDQHDEAQSVHDLAVALEKLPARIEAALAAAADGGVMAGLAKGVAALKGEKK